MANVFQRKPMSHLHNGQPTDNTSHTPPISWHRTTVRPHMNKAQKTLNMLKKNLKQASTTVKSQAYKTIVRPQLEYASAIWDPHTAKAIHV